MLKWLRTAVMRTGHTGGTGCKAETSGTKCQQWKWMYFLNILGWTNETCWWFDVGCKRQKGIEQYYEVWGTTTRKIKLPMTQMGKRVWKLVAGHNWHLKFEPLLTHPKGDVVKWVAGSMNLNLREEVHTTEIKRHQFIEDG